MHYFCRTRRAIITGSFDLRQFAARPSSLGLAQQTRFPYPPHSCRFLPRSFHTRASSPPRQASFTWIFAVVGLIVGGTAAAQFVYSTSRPSRPQASPEPVRLAAHGYLGEVDTLTMSSTEISPGHVGNLTDEQEAKLREMWAVLLKLMGVKFEELSPKEGSSEGQQQQEKEKKSKRSWLGLRTSDKSNSQSDTNGASNGLENLSLSDGDDKYGQNKDFQQILASKTPEELRETFWQMVKHDHPDALLLRFLRARKWDVTKAVVMLVSTIRWRADEMHVDDDIMYGGEARALEQSQSSDPEVKKLGEDFLAQLRIGKSFIHGVDKQGRPLCLIRVRLHKLGAQSEKSMERYTVHMIETARAMLPRPVETAVIIFDMTNFTLANMDYAPVKFIIKCFEANYPESLGAVLIHNAPWIFSGIWKVIKGWLDPVVAAKVHFTSSVEDLEEFIPRERILKELGGPKDFEYKYIEPQPDENAAMKDTAKRDEVKARYLAISSELQELTRSWIVAASKGDKTEEESVKSRREELAGKLSRTYWELDPYIRARSYYDRVGMLKGDGKVVFYPELQEDKSSGSEDAANGEAVTQAN